MKEIGVIQEWRGRGGTDEGREEGGGRGVRTMKQYAILTNQSSSLLFFPLSTRPSSHQDLAPVPISLTDFPVQ